MNHPLLERCGQYTLPQEVKAKGIYPYYRPIESGQDPVVDMKGKKVLMFGSNSYLGLSDDPRLKEAAIEAIKKYGTSCSGSRFLNGTLDIHLELEEKLAKLVGKDEAVTYSTGFQTNLGVVSCLSFRDSFIYLDALDHACIIDGARLGFGKTFKFAHNDVRNLEQKLRLAPRRAPKLIVVDGIFSMEGDIAPLPEICALAEKYRAAVMLDDAHAFGVIGEGGRGTASHFGLTDKVDLIMGTFSKSFGSLGGFIATDKTTMNYLKHLGLVETEADVERLALVNASSRNPELSQRWIEEIQSQREQLDSSIELMRTQRKSLQGILDNVAKMETEI